jgi:hypothetical protein
VTVTRNFTYRPPGTSPVGVPRISTRAASFPWVDVVVADEVGASVATGADVAAGVAAGIAAGVEAAVAGDVLGVPVEAAGAGLALGVAWDEQPVTAPTAAAARAAGTATRPSMAGIRGIRRRRGARRAVDGVAAVFMFCSLRDTAVTRIGVTEDGHANNFCRGFPEVSGAALPGAAGGAGKMWPYGTSRSRKAWWRGSHDRDRP